MVQSLTTAQFDQFLETTQVVVAIFSAEWCEPCHTFKAIVQALAEAMPDVRFGVVDIEKEEELGHDFSIRSIPTTMIFREHVALLRESGTMTSSALADLIQQAKKLDMQEVHHDIAQQLFNK